jgi:hypothetical protein
MKFLRGILTTLLTPIEPLVWRQISGKLQGIRL